MASLSSNSFSLDASPIPGEDHGRVVGSQCDWDSEGCVRHQFPHLPLEKCNIEGCNQLLHIFAKLTGKMQMVCLLADVLSCVAGIIRSGFTSRRGKFLPQYLPPPPPPLLQQLHQLSPTDPIQHPPQTSHTHNSRPSLHGLPFCGVVMKAAAAGNQVRGKKQHPIKFDLLPFEHNVVVVKRSIIRVLVPGEDEPEYDEKQARIDALNEMCEHPFLQSNEYGSGEDMASVGSSDSGGENEDNEGSAATGRKKKKRKKPRCAREMERFIQEQSEYEIAITKSYKHYYGEDDNQFIEWTILQPGEEIVEDAMQLPESPGGPFKIDIPCSRYPKDMNYTATFFDHFFLSLQGKAKVLDEYLASPACSCHNMVVSDNIRFH
jgi:hypothetical protein